MKKVLLRVLLGVAGVIVLLVLLVIGVIAFDTLFPSQTAAGFTNVTYPGPGGTLRAYLAKPDGQGPFPAVLMVHEFYGINADIVKKADLLAGEGYVVLAADAYRGKTTKLVPRAIWLVISTPQEQIQADLDEGYNYLAALPEVDPGRIAAAGFCFGGTQVMRLATRNPNLAGVAIFYGSGPITDPEALGVMGRSGPVLGIYGAEDTSIPLDEVRGFEAAMQARSVPHEVSVYPGVGHAFVQYDTLLQPGPAQDAWNQMLAFFARNLKD